MVATSDAVARVRYVSLLMTAAMVAFAANSVLCRAALGGEEIDTASFSAIRLLSGALALAAIHAVRRGARTPRRAGDDFDVVFGTRTSRELNAKPMPYWCTDCRSYFSVRTGTALERSKVPLRKWAFAARLHDVTPCHRRRPPASAGLVLGVLQSANLGR